MVQWKLVENLNFTKRIAKSVIAYNIHTLRGPTKSIKWPYKTEILKFQKISVFDGEFCCLLIQFNSIRHVQFNLILMICNVAVNARSTLLNWFFRDFIVALKIGRNIDEASFPIDIKNHYFHSYVYFIRWKL